MSLIKIIDQTLEAEKPYESKSPPTFKIKPSMLGSPCLRKIYYSAGGVPQDYDTDLKGKKRMALGDSIHSVLHKIFRKSGKMIDYVNPDGTIPTGFDGEPDQEFPLVVPELFIKKGKIDAVLIIDGKLWLGEFKSIKSDYFNQLHGPKDDHMIQGTTYYYAFNKLLKEGKYSHIKQLDGFEKAEGIIFLYVNKDTQDMVEFVRTEADQLFRTIVEKIFTVKDFHDQQVLPPKTPDFCGTCPWRAKCKKNQVK